MPSRDRTERFWEVPVGRMDEIDLDKFCKTAAGKNERDRWIESGEKEDAWIMVSVFYLSEH